MSAVTTGRARSAREREVAGVGAGRAFALLGRHARLVRADARDLGAHHRAVDEVEAQRLEALEIARRVEVGVDEPVREPRQPVVVEVHHGEGDLVHRVDPAEGLVELDRVEGHRDAVDQGHVAQVQVAVALAHEAVVLAPREDGLEAVELAKRPRAERLADGARVLAVVEELELGEVVDGFREDLRRRAEGALGARARHAPVEGGHAAREGFDLRGAELTRLRHAVQQGLLREAAHLHRVVEHEARAAEGRRLGRAGHRHHVEVEAGRGAAVQAQLLLAVEAARFQRGEVDEAEAYGLLDLVGEVTGQQHPGDVRLEELDRAHGMRIAARAPQQLDEAAASRPIRPLRAWVAPLNGLRCAAPGLPPARKSRDRSSRTRPGPASTSASVPPGSSSSSSSARWFSMASTRVA